MKNSIFNPSRFALTARKYITENGHTLLIRATTLFGLVLFACVFFGIIDANDRHSVLMQYEISKKQNNIEGYQQQLFERYQKQEKTHPNDPLSGEVGFALVAMFAFAIYIGSAMIEHTETKAGRINLYSQPSTYFEKYLIRWLIVVPGCIVACIISFILSDLIRTGVVSMIYPDLLGNYHFNYSNLVRNFYNRSEIIWIFTGFYLALQSIFMLGSVICRRNAFIKTFATTSIMVLIMFGLLYMGVQMQKMENVIDDTLYMYYNSSPMNISPNVFTYILFILTASNWYIVYLRLKENDVVQRLF